MPHVSKRVCLTFSWLGYTDLCFNHVGGKGGGKKRKEHVLEKCVFSWFAHTGLYFTHVGGKGGVKKQATCFRTCGFRLVGGTLECEHKYTRPSRPQLLSSHEATQPSATQKKPSIWSFCARLLDRRFHLSGLLINHSSKGTIILSQSPPAATHDPQQTNQQPPPPS